MSRMTCLIIFSGCSALSIKSFRLARINVDTRSSNAITSSKSPCDCSLLFQICVACLLQQRPSRDPRAHQHSDGQPCPQPEDPAAREHSRHGAQHDPQNYPGQRDLFHGLPTPSCFPPQLVLLDYLPAALLLPVAGASSSPDGLGALSPICRTFESRSVMLIPESDSNSAGTCAAICAMSPVILLAPADVPLPVDTIVILSTLESGCDMARTTSGSPVISLSTTAAWLYS